MTFVVTRQRAQEVHDRARARAGLPYAYGGAFTNDPKRSTDCSGLVLQTAAWYGGRTDWVGNRYGSTESFRLDHKIVYDLGFRRMPPGGLAALPFKPVMLVGLQHGGGGVNSHTACTLMTMDIPGGPVKMSDRGVDWESRGGNPGVRLYDGARAWNDPLFHDFWYLDARLEDGVPANVDRVEILARATGLTYNRSAVLLPALSEGLKLAECTNPNRIAMYLAQIGHEADNFEATEEYASGDAYDTRTDLGNTPEVDGDGRLYKGRSWVMITGKDNYRDFSRWAHGKGLVPTADYFVVHPHELAELKWAGIGAAWYWTVERPDINALSDRRDLETVTRRINGGLTNIDDRRRRYNLALAVGDQLLELIGDDDELADPAVVKMIRELHGAMFNTVVSQSPYRFPKNPDGSEPRENLWQLHELIKNGDGMTHMQYVEASAKAGDLTELARVVAAAKGQGAVRDRWLIERATRVLAEIERDNPDVLRAYIAKNGAL
ncbi:LysA [Mycobacterium phage AnnaL29]|uniref:endolysin n=1 Tax=Mycobacterium phage AnnaL29 TaxID=1076630 RepID=UPI00024DEB07|nr:endolysin [Mycobacterium phage AnnaL29]AGS82694.1 LysA [Mycobacterium phage AnnaL29]